MLMRLLQLSIAGAVMITGYEYKWTPNMTLLSILGFCAAYGFTIIPLQIYLWWLARHERRIEHARRASLGLPYGWRRHLPWNARKTEASLLRTKATGLSRKQRTESRL